MRQDSKFSVVFACFACAGLIACGDDASSSALENTESSAIEESSSSDSVPSSSVTLSSSSIEVSSSSVNGDSGFPEQGPGQALAGMTSSNSGDSGSATFSDTTKITYALKPFDGPLSNPHKGFTVPTGGAWTFVPEFEYGPYGSLNNRAWDLVSYGSGYQQWNKLNPAKGVYDWTELEKLLNALAEHNMGYALRVFPYSPSFIMDNDTPEENYDWTPKFVYNELGAKKITATYKGNGSKAVVPVWDDPNYLQAAKDFATALAQKYDGDPRIEYIDIRSFGEWGEWHVSNLDGSQMPSEKIQKEMLDHYASVFKKTQLVLPSNGFGDVYTHALDLGITKRDDGFIGIPGRPDTLLRAYNANLPTIAENIAGYRTMLANDDLIPGGTQKWTAERWVDAITTAHLTYYVLDQDNDCGYYFYKDNKALADSMSKVIGYNFTVTRAELTTVAGGAETTGEFADTAAGNVATNTLNITVKNTGVAPSFFDVYLVAEFVDSTGAAIAQLGKTIRIPKGTFKDGASLQFSFGGAVPADETNLATQPGVSVALSLYESEGAFKNGKNPTVRFDNDGLQENNKLLLHK
ncbi:beta-galactosidase [Fibrobacter sp. UWH4]|uniref:beta-galactosidase n=1 Tax=Fibrobacter sp. UWH4 TaxID=1896210 RepID=UPI000912239F|nr:beta-galactosidase [Fibrobacter sp. UWH4]SHK60741.1 Beta-galactosidase [Fibrobacter sp. UWH4]